MADLKISELGAIAAVASADVLPIVDTSLSETNKVSVEDLLRSAPAGTAAAPSIAFVDDPDTGFYRSAANELSISTGGTQRVVVDDAGNVGIGTSSPASTLEVAAPDGAGSSEVLRVKKSNAGDACVFRIDLNPDANEVKYQSTGSQSGAHVWGTGSTSEYMRIDSAGNVGIGTSSPVGALNVQGTGAAPSLTYDSANLVNLDQGGVQLAMGIDPVTPFGTFLQGRDSSNAARSLLLNPVGGNVGIGTSSPTEKLQVTQGHILLDNGYSLRIKNSTGGAQRVIHLGTDDNLYLNANAQDNNLIFQSGVSTERMRIDSAGNVGIGTSSPGSPLEVQTASGERITLDSAGASQQPRIGLIRDAGVDYFIQNSQGLFEIKKDSDYIYRYASETHRFITAGVGERMRIKSNGVINYANCPTYADDTAAGTGGLAAGDIYKTSTGELRIKL